MVLLHLQDYLLSACGDTGPRCERRCHYSPEVFQRLVPMRDELERASSAVVRFEAAGPEASSVVVSGLERNVAIAVRYLEAKAQDLMIGRLAKDATIESGISLAGTQSREVSHVVCLTVCLTVALPNQGRSQKWG